MLTSVLRLGILGASETIQTTILPALTSLSTHYKLTIIYDQNESLAKHCQKHFNITYSTTSTEHLITHPEVDLVLNLLPFEYHEKYTIAALEAGKHVMVEVPLSLSIHGLRRIRIATKKGMTNRSNDNSYDPPKIFVGCAHRYAPCFTDIFKKELATLGRVYYARCRNISGPLRIPTQPSNTSTSTNDYGITTNTNTNSNAVPASQNTAITTHLNDLLADIFGEDLTPDRIAFCRFLGNLGCHDLSLMRESLGLPDAVANVAITDPFYSAIFHYMDSGSICGSSGEGYPFTVLYETGVDSIPRCDAHLTIYGATKTISVEYDFPSLARPVVVGGAVRVVIEEVGDCFDRDGRPRVKRTEAVSSVDESYEREFLAMHSYFVETGTGGEAKTTANDALMDLRLLNMIFEHYDRQCGTIRTPLG